MPQTVFLKKLLLLLSTIGIYCVAKSQTCIWRGDADSSWENSLNWSCGHTPDSTTDVYVNKGIVYIGKKVICRSLTVNPSAQVIVLPGFNIAITGMADTVTSPPVNDKERIIESIEMFPGRKLISSPMSVSSGYQSMRPTWSL